MIDPHKLDTLREYLLSQFGRVRHPFDERDDAKAHRFADLPRLVKAFLDFLCLENEEPRLRATGPDLVDEFHRFHRTPQGDLSGLKSSVKDMSLCFEPFLKKVAYHRFLDDEAHARVWRGGLNKLLEDGVLIALPSRLKNVSVDYWKEQPIATAVIRDTFHLRNLSSHEARTYDTQTLVRYARSVLAACLFVASENLELLESTVKVKREWSAYLEYWCRRFDDEGWEEEKVYLDLRCEGETNQQVDLNDRVTEFLDNEHDRVLLIAGRPGAGKTTFLERRVFYHASVALAELEAAPALRPSGRVPLYIDLNNFSIDAQRSFCDYVAQASGLARYVQSDSMIDHENWEKTFKSPPVPLLLCLDALDEMDSGQRATWAGSLREINSFLTRISIVSLLGVVDSWYR